MKLPTGAAVGAADAALSPPLTERGVLMRPNAVKAQYFPDLGQTSWYTKILPQLERVGVAGITFITGRSIRRLIDEAPVQDSDV